MKFSSRDDVEAPADTVFDAITDIEMFERRATRRGARITRLDDLAEVRVGSAWQVGFSFRGKPHEARMEVVKLVRPELLELTGTSSSFEVMSQVMLEPLSRQRTRMVVELEIAPRSLGARLMLQSAKLGKAALSRRFDERIAALARAIERRGALAGG